MRKDDFYLLKSNTNKDDNSNTYRWKWYNILFQITLTKVCNPNIYIDKQFYISFKIILNIRFLLFKIQGWYCHQFVLCKWVNLQKPRNWDKKYDEKLGWELQGHRGEDSLNGSTLINTLSTTCKRRALQGNICAFFLHDSFKTGFQMRI